MVRGGTEVRGLRAANDAKRIGLDFPFAVHHASARCLVESRTIRVPIDPAVASFPACGSRGGFQIGSLPRKQCLDVRPCHVRSECRADQAKHTRCTHENVYSDTHDLSLNEIF